MRCCRINSHGRFAREGLLVNDDSRSALDGELQLERVGVLMRIVLSSLLSTVKVHNDRSQLLVHSPLGSGEDAAVQTTYMVCGRPLGSLREACTFSMPSRRALKSPPFLVSLLSVMLRSDVGGGG